MGELLNLCMSAMQELYLEVKVKEVNTKKREVREMLFKKLVAVFYGVSAMLKHLGYTEADLQSALRQAQVDTIKM